MKNFKKILIFSIAFSIIFYILGIFSGMKIFEFLYLKNLQNYQELEMELMNIRKNLENYVYTKDCEYLKNYLNLIKKEVQIYREYLPYRLENLTDIYSSVLNEYYKTQALIWLIAKEYEKCDKNYKTLLYFIDNNCSLCLKQGEEIDKIKEYLISKNIEIDIFTVGIKVDYPYIRKIKEEFNISSAPSFIFDSRVFNFTPFENFINITKI